MNLRALLLGAFIGAAAAWYFATASVRIRKKRTLEEEALDRIWHSIVGDRDVRTDALTERVH